jgi:aspartate carbamoyltransferase catalytic subunit
MLDLLNDIAAFTTAHNLSDRRFGELALNDTKFVRDLKNGRSPSLNTVEKVKTFMLSYREDAQ